MALIKGTKVILFEKKKVGVDDFGADVFSEKPVTVGNVLIAPASSTDATSSTQLSAKTAIYDLHIPKGDAHNWEDSKVEFYGSVWHTVGRCLRWASENVPGDWDRKIQVEIYV